MWIYLSNLVIKFSIKSVINVGARLCSKVPINVKNLEEYKPYRREPISFLIDRAFYLAELLCYCLTK